MQQYSIHGILTAFCIQKVIKMKLNQKKKKTLIFKSSMETQIWVLFFFYFSSDIHPILNCVSVCNYTVNY